MNPSRYYSMLPEDDGSKCMYCGRTEELVGLYSPSRDSPIYQNEVNLRVSACKRCRTKVYPFRLEYRTHQQKVDFLKGNVAVGPKNNKTMVNGDLLPCRLKQTEADEGFEIKPGSIKGQCSYCKEHCEGNRDFVPTREMAKYIADVPKHVLPACVKCLNRLKMKSLVTHTFEGRLKIIQNIEAKRVDREDRRGLLPWQLRVIDGDKTHVIDRPDSELSGQVLIMKRTHDEMVRQKIEEALRSATVKEEITAALVPEGDVDDIISGWEHG